MENVRKDRDIKLVHSVDPPLPPLFIGRVENFEKS